MRNCAARSLSSRIIVARCTATEESSRLLISFPGLERAVPDDYGGPICGAKPGSNLAVAEIFSKNRKKLAVIGPASRNSILRCSIRELAWNRERFVTGEPRLLNPELLTEIRPTCQALITINYRTASTMPGRSGGIVRWVYSIRIAERRCSFKYYISGAYTARGYRIN